MSKESGSTLGALPFMKVAEDGAVVDWWCVEATGRWTADGAQGRLYGHALVARMKADGETHLLQRVVQAIMRKGKMTGLECGFLQAIASRAIGN